MESNIFLVYFPKLINVIIYVLVENTKKIIIVLNLRHRFRVFVFQNSKKYSWNLYKIWISRKNKVWIFVYVDDTLFINVLENTNGNRGSGDTVSISLIYEFWDRLEYKMWIQNTKFHFL